MMNILTKVWQLVKKYRWYLIATVVFAAALYGYSWFQNSKAEEAQSFSVVQAVGRGGVSSGIETTGEIVAAEKLDLDVYKQLARIDAVNIQNGGHVEAGDVLVSFDKSDASVSARSSAVSVAQAQLDLETAQKNASDPNTQIRTLENQITGYEKSITDAYVDFLNQNLDTKPSSNQSSRLSDSTQPSVSGRYVSDTEGEYVVEVYSSGAPSGYSYRVSGLERYSGSVIFGTATDLGNHGLKITFPSPMANTVRTGDSWIISVPNTGVATYEETKRNYEKEVDSLKVSLANAEQELADLKQTDSSAYRDLDVEKAELSLSEARQRLSENYDAIEERDIVAPFAGSIQDMQNVVVGATPTGGSEDSISLGTLISDEYLVTFTLDAADAAKVTVGQKVQVVVTSYADQPEFAATISEVSSLPSGSGVAQYEVRALLDYDAKTAETILREGMLADIVVVQEEKQDVLRVPTSAITYKEGRPTVQVVADLTEEQQQQFERMGIVRTSGTELASYPVTVELGVEGRFYTEIVSGLTEGDLILTTSATMETDNPAVQTGFSAPAGGAVRIQNGQGSGSNRNFQGGGTGSGNGGGG